MNKINNPKKYAAELVKKVFKGKYGDIVSVKPIHLGYTNESFIVTFANDKKFQVRIPHCGNLINRVDEYKVLKLLKNEDFVYFDVKSGIAIKQWIYGKNPRISFWSKWKKVDELFSLIKKIHQTPTPKGTKFKKIDFDTYNLNLYRVKLSYQAKFLSIIDTYKDDLCVLNHTDINAQNIIEDNRGKLHLIDFEWCALAPDYWDYANFIRESRITWYTKIDWKKYIPNFDLKKLKDYIFACSVYAYLWTWAMPQTPKIKRYRKRTLRQIAWYGRGALGHEEK
ncbi:MAG: hypothetical protein ACOQNV_03155 [Mycoplasmoidaceae bacterium]